MVQEVVGSNMAPFARDALKPDKRGYGQNGFGKASSDVPGERTTSGFLPQTEVAEAMKLAAGKSDPRYPGDASGKDRPRTFAVKPQPIPGPQTRTLMGANAPLAFGMDTRSPRNR